MRDLSAQRPVGGSTGSRQVFARRVNFILAISVAVAAVVAASIGAARIGPGTVVAMFAHRLGLPVPASWDETTEAIIFMVRMPRVVLALLVGSGLAACGAAFQGLFRNPMADPYVIGVSPGAALGATIAIVFRLNFSFLGLSTIPLFAFAGGLTTAGIVYSLSRLRGTIAVESLLLTGIAVGSLLSAFTSLLMVMAQRDLNHVFFWIMGGLSGRTWSHVSMVVPYWLLGVGLLVYSIRELNLMLLGEEEAYHLGADVSKVKTRILLASSMAAAASVAAAGIVGFVGLMVPHIVRLITGPDHRLFLPATLMAGSATLVVADVLARTVLAPEEIPLGVVTALMGAPFFLYLLRRKVEVR